MHTSCSNDYQAAITFLKPPTEDFSKAVIFPVNGMAVGVLAIHKTAVIQEKAGCSNDEHIKNALAKFPNAKFIIGAGSCFTFENSELNLGDVLVSDKISDISNFKLDKRKLENRGQIVDMTYELQEIFCINTEHDSEVKSTNERLSQVYDGTMVSHPSQIDDKDIRTAIQSAVPNSIGGEMDGWKLMRFVSTRVVKGVILIKGVADKGNVDSVKNWQFTAAMAALNYIESKLLLIPDLKCKLALSYSFKCHVLF